MRIVHLCLSNYYVDGYSYQENELVGEHVRAGHEVTVVASTETFGANREIVYLQPSEYIGQDGAPVIRLPYRNFLIPFLSRKVRAYPGVADILRKIDPDVIMFHGASGWELVTVAQYKVKNPAVKVFVDSHEDATNSARTFFSRWGLHFGFYRPILRYCLPRIEKILCVNVAAIDFLVTLYGIPRERLEFFPLGGAIITDEEYEKMRSEGRARAKVSASSIVFVQSGKFDASKKLLQSLEAFAQIKAEHARFFIAGHLHDDIRARAEMLIKSDPRVTFLGWQTPSALRALLCAADVYVQPGTQSATMQMSLSCRCAVILDDVPSHYPYLRANGWLVSDEASLLASIQDAVSSTSNLQMMSTRSLEIARELLDYRKLAARICQ